MSVSFIGIQNSDSNYRAFSQTARYNMAARQTACEEDETVDVGTTGTAHKPL